MVRPFFLLAAAFVAVSSGAPTDTPEDTCHKIEGCEDCLTAGCAFHGSCSSVHCPLLADVNCVQVKGEHSEATECAKYNAKKADSVACSTGPASCQDCTSRTMANGEPCSWFNDVEACWARGHGGGGIDDVKDCDDVPKTDE